MKRKALICIVAGLIILCAIVLGICFVANSAAGGTAEERISKAEEFVAEGRIKKAENTYKSVIRDNPEDIETSKSLAMLYIENRSYKKAEKLLHELISENDEDFSLYETMLKIYRANGDVKAAFSFIGSVEDTELRRRCIDIVYDRNSESSLVMGNTPGNYANNGVIAFWKDAVLYCDQSDGNKLFKLENGENKLLCDGDINSLSVVGDYVYYINNSEKGRIFRMKVDGSEGEQIGDIPAKQLMIIGNKMYFINLKDNKVYRMELDGKGLKKISDTKTNMLYYYGAKFFIENPQNIETTLRLSIDGEDEELFFNNSSYFVNGYDDMIYFRDNTDVGIWGVSTRGAGYGKIHESRSGYINTGDGYLYFVDLEDNGTIIKMKTGSDEKTKLISDGATFLALDGDFIYYFSKNDGKKLYRIKTDGTGRVRLN